MEMTRKQYELLIKIRDGKFTCGDINCEDCIFGQQFGDCDKFSDDLFKTIIPLIIAGYERQIEDEIDVAIRGERAKIDKQRLDSAMKEFVDEHKPIEYIEPPQPTNTHFKGKTFFALFAYGERRISKIQYISEPLSERGFFDWIESLLKDFNNNNGYTPKIIDCKII